MVSLNVNGLSVEANATPDTPLLWVLRDHLGLTGTKFGCGIAQCGACTVHLDGRPVRSCVLPVGLVKGRAVTTIEAIGQTRSGQKVQEAWLDLEVVQCGYCQSGQIMAAAVIAPQRQDYTTCTDLERPMEWAAAGARPLRSPGNLTASKSRAFGRAY